MFVYMWKCRLWQWPRRSSVTATSCSCNQPSPEINRHSDLRVGWGGCFGSRFGSRCGGYGWFLHFFSCSLRGLLIATNCILAFFFFLQLVTVFNPTNYILNLILKKAYRFGFVINFTRIKNNFFYRWLKTNLEYFTGRKHILEKKNVDFHIYVWTLYSIQVWLQLIFMFFIPFLSFNQRGGWYNKLLKGIPFNFILLDFNCSQFLFEIPFCLSLKYIAHSYSIAFSFQNHCILFWLYPTDCQFVLSNWYIIE